jgi:hypothetical protein
MNDILTVSPIVLGELAREFVRRADEEYRKNPTSQATACFFLAIRSASLLLGMRRLLVPETRDSSEVLVRGYLEARDLLLTFRFDEEGTRKKIAYWFEGKMGPSWKPEHKKCDEFMEKLGHGGSEFGKKWSQITTLAHPTRFATQNSIASARLWAANPPSVEDHAALMEPKIADYLTCIGSLIVIGTIDLPGLIALACDPARMPHVDTFQQNVSRMVVPILSKTDSDLPPSSHRT